MLKLNSPLVLEVKESNRRGFLDNSLFLRRTTDAVYKILQQDPREILICFLIRNNFYKGWKYIIADDFIYLFIVKLKNTDKKV